MARKAVSVPHNRRIAIFCCVVLALLICAGSATASAQAAQEGAFSAETASRLLDQIASGLLAQNPSRMLAAFDLDKMADGPLFRQQIISFFSETENIRVHFNQIQTSTEAGKNLVTVLMEIDAARSDARLPPLRKRAELRFEAETSAKGWKFSDVQPRTFFSTQP